MSQSTDGSRKVRNRNETFDEQQLADGPSVVSKKQSFDGEGRNGVSGHGNVLAWNVPHPGAICRVDMPLQGAVPH